MLPRSQPSRGYLVGIAVSNLRQKDCCASVIRSCPRRVDRSSGPTLQSGDPRCGTLSAGSHCLAVGEQAECRKTREGGCMLRLSRLVAGGAVLSMVMAGIALVPGGVASASTVAALWHMDETSGTTMTDSSGKVTTALCTT